MINCQSSSWGGGGGGGKGWGGDKSAWNIDDLICKLYKFATFSSIESHSPINLGPTLDIYNSVLLTLHRDYHSTLYSMP